MKHNHKDGDLKNLLNSMYTKCTAKIILNGEKHRSFLIKSGKRPGCPVSPLFHSIILEFLANAISQGKEMIEQSWKVRKTTVFVHRSHGSLGRKSKRVNNKKDSWN